MNLCSVIRRIALPLAYLLVAYMLLDQRMPAQTLTPTGFTWSMEALQAECVIPRCQKLPLSPFKLTAKEVEELKAAVPVSDIAGDRYNKGGIKTINK